MSREPDPPRSTGPVGVPVLDAHVHLWDPGVLDYPWLGAEPALQKPFLPTDLNAATLGLPIDEIICVEANPRPDQGVREMNLLEGLARTDPRIRAIVAFCDLTSPGTVPSTLERLVASSLVRGIRHNIQGQPPGFCLRPDFVDGVRAAGEAGLTFDLCATHEQLPEVARLVSACPSTRFVLDHCGKPAIRDRSLDPWRTNLRALSSAGDVWCKISGLLTEAGSGWHEDDLLPYVSHAAECFGPNRIVYGSDWPVLTLAGWYTDWYQFSLRFIEQWNSTGARLFFRDNAIEAYGL